MTLMLGTVIACGQSRRGRIEEWGFQVVQRYPHDAGAFTQGLQWFEGKLYEGTGRYGSSSLRRVDLQSGVVELRTDLSEKFFGEGITILGDKIYQLTWENRVCFVYDLKTFDRVATLSYAGQGWGLTTDGKHLIMSDGSAQITFVDPENFRVVRKVVAHWGKEKVHSLNELEYVEGEIWANIWQQDRIVRLSPKDGEVLGMINLAGIYPRSVGDQERVLNGIAYDETSKKLYVTGKYWPQLFEIKLTKPGAAK